MSEFEKALHQEAKAVSENLDGTVGQLLALTHAGYKAWAKEGNLHFPEPKRYALLHEILRYCAYGSLLECSPTQWDSLREIAEMLDARYPRYACTPQPLWPALRLTCQRCAPCPPAASDTRLVRGGRGVGKVKFSI